MDSEPDEKVSVTSMAVVRSVVVFAGLATAAMISCQPPESASREAAGVRVGTAMADGRTVGDLLSRETASVVLVYPPSECFSCTGLLPQWIGLGREWGVPVRLVLTRQPTPAEANKLKLLRVVPAGVLKAEPSDTLTSSAYVFDGMTELASAIGASNQSALLAELATPASQENESTPIYPPPTGGNPHD